jgi:hypothetical protein
MQFQHRDGRPVFSPALFAALQANSSVGKLGSGVVFGHHGTALIAGAYIHDLHNDVSSQVL